ncbi:MAG: flavodoxin family protein [Anaerolineae bacterium]|jgi:multimeric flavodoxin WrbA|nr:flavodoxin family protein [Chloroflexota bacterium]
MHIIGVLGSPHSAGPSSTLAREVLRGAQDAGHTVKIYELNQMSVRGCQGCRTCKDQGVDCIVEDDLLPYWAELHSAGGLVVSAPNYASQVCGPMITYMNRHYCLLDRDWKVRIHPGIKLVGVFSQGNQNREQYLPVYRWFLGDFENRDMQLVDTIVHTRADAVTPGSPLMERAYRVGRSL